MDRSNSARRRLRLAALIALTAAAPLAAQPGSGAELRPELAKHFARYDADGAFVLYDLRKDHWIRYNADRAARRFIPASTFKIFSSLVALETGIIADENVAIAWDGVDRGNPDWNRDHDLRSAFRYSAVWFYQELARRIGEERMQAFVRRERYGNQDIAGGIDRFWLDGALRISPDEQIDLLRRLHADSLGFSARSMAIVRDIMVIERTPAYTLRGKTGWAGPIGWLVGWVERGDDVYFFAMNLESHADRFPMVEARREITYGILRELGVLPAE